MQFKNILLFASALAGFAIATPVPDADAEAAAEAVPAADPMANAFSVRNAFADPAALLV